jgi:hypothetical protein
MTPSSEARIASVEYEVDIKPAANASLAERGVVALLKLKEMHDQHAGENHGKSDDARDMPEQFASWHAAGQVRNGEFREKFADGLLTLLRREATETEGLGFVAPMGRGASRQFALGASGLMASMQLRSYREWARDIGLKEAFKEVQGLLPGIADLKRGPFLRALLWGALTRGSEPPSAQLLRMPACQFALQGSLGAHIRGLFSFEQRASHLWRHMTEDRTAKACLSGLFGKDGLPMRLGGTLHLRWRGRDGKGTIVTCAFFSWDDLVVLLVALHTGHPTGGAFPVGEPRCSPSSKVEAPLKSSAVGWPKYLIFASGGTRDQESVKKLDRFQKQDLILRFAPNASSRGCSPRSKYLPRHSRAVCKAPGCAHPLLPLTLLGSQSVGLPRDAEAEESSRRLRAELGLSGVPSKASRMPRFASCGASPRRPPS